MKYACVRQHDKKDCGAACLATIAKHYGLNMPIAKIRQLASTDMLGTNVIGMVTAAEKLGFDAKAVNGSKKAFFSGFVVPAIAHVKLKSGFYHYIVIHKVTKKKIIVADPNQGVVNYSHEEFFAIWTGILILMSPTSNFRKGNETENSFVRFARLLVPQRKLLVTVCLASMMITILGIGASFYFRFIMDGVSIYSASESLITITVGVGLLYGCQSILMFFRSRLMQYLSQNLDIPLMLGYYNHVMELPMDFFGTRRVGEITSRFSDATKIRSAVSGVSMTIMIDSVMALFGGFVLATQNMTLFLLSMVMILAHATIVYLFRRPIRYGSRATMEANAQMNSYMVESLHGIETVKAFGNERHVQYKAEELFMKVLKLNFYNGTVSSAENAITSFISNVGSIAILCVGTSMILKGTFTFGQLITFNALLRYFSGPLQRLINVQPTIQTAVIAADRLSEVLDLETEENATLSKWDDKLHLNQRIRIENLSFRYGTRELVLKGINMTIQPGERVAIVGQSGSGKTTLSKLLLRFYEWEEGTIQYGDIDIRDIPKSVLRKKTAYISQNNFLFSGTIEENLLFGNPEANMKDIIEACKQSHADEFINKLPSRYQTMLEENASNLSGGQQQRLAIARALIRKPEILIMDEATSNLDTMTEKGIQNTIDSLPQTMTVIVIAHRLSTIKQCNKIFVFDDGTIVEVGTHAELMQKKNKYYDLWKDQFPDL